MDPFKVENSPGFEVSVKDFSFEDNFVPINPIPETSKTNLEAQKSLQSQAYLDHLEAKLKKVKGNYSPGKLVNSKDIISSLCQVRLDASENLVSGDSVVCDESGEDRATVEVNDLKRRMLPEQAMTIEELTNLLERDYLNAVTQHIRQDDNDGNQSR